MPLSRENLERRAIKAGVKASKRRHQVVSEQELLALRVQTMPLWLRIALVLLGAGLISAAWLGWPVASNIGEGVEAIGGIFAVLFGAFGVRRTVEQVVDSFSADLAEIILEAVIEAISNIDL
jgi:hypothetical protein